MPCNCIGDRPTYPQNEEWGPLLWWVLHALADKAGRQTDKLMRADEERAWPLLVKGLSPSVPCPYCRDHLDEYMRQYPFTLPSEYIAWNDYISTYFYELHESVNARLGKPSFQKENLHPTYNNTKPFKEKLDFLTKFMDRAIKMGGVSLLSWRAFLKQLTLLRATIL